MKYVLFLKDFIYLFLERGEGKEKGSKRNINVWLPHVCSLLGTWPATQAYALTGNRTSDFLVHRLMVCMCVWGCVCRERERQREREREKDLSRKSPAIVNIMRMVCVT